MRAVGETYGWFLVISRLAETKVFDIFPSVGNLILPSDSRLRVDLCAKKKGTDY